jgi:hypothetical protein
LGGILYKKKLPDTVASGSSIIGRRLLVATVAVATIAALVIAAATTAVATTATTRSLEILGSNVAYLNNGNLEVESLTCHRVVEVHNYALALNSLNDTHHSLAGVSCDYVKR